MYEDELPDSFATRVKSCSLRRSRCSLERDEPSDLLSEKAFHSGVGDARRSTAEVQIPPTMTRSGEWVASAQGDASWQGPQASYTRCVLLRPMPVTTPRGDLVDKFFHKFNDADLALLSQDQTSPAKPVFLAS
jgi:hypothetical protein